MAIPFNLPEDQNEVEIIISQLQSLLTKLQAAVRRSRGVVGTDTQQLVVPRVRTMMNRSRNADGSSPAATSSASSSNIPDLLSNLATLASATHEVANSSAAGSSSMVRVTNCMTRSPRRRTSSESSSCDETKISITTIRNRGIQQDWNQDVDGENGVQPKPLSFDGILSNLITGPASAPLWTAMICFVGWHLFKAR